MAGTTADPPGIAGALASLPGDGHGIAVIVLFAVCVVALRMHRAAMTRPPPPGPATCGWTLAGRDSERQRWLWHCTACGGTGSGTDHAPPRTCVDFHGHIRAAAGGRKTG